ncbi:Sphingoid long-chain base transporter RSB1 [Sparassis crispa]|uniref:Sphingoid long-chain base transporter RSB1 n=1 Tax=Sparassis crispa TaxID=139825 RepID=A0A401GS19_9APHY|nr:Sphingoid long-chain base transporter RSB1 [Sparassis crispa]GBE84524.1 Sphingoid long-chain base transporter RSB1 [Sparassis crispa]
MSSTANIGRSSQSNPYGYVPTEWICIVFIALFAVSTFIHVLQALHYRLWWLFATPCLCGALEILGWVGRLWSSQDHLSLTPYIIQMSSTIIAPTPLIAANFVILGEIIRRLGSCYSRLSARWYSRVFVSCDVVALIAQAAGGATAAMAVEDNSNPADGGHVMLGGIVFQMAAITLYMILATEFILRFHYKKPLRKDDSAGEHSFDSKTKFMLLGLAITNVFIYIRSVYRTIELVDGWDGTIIQTQVYFNVFDAAMITVAMYVLNAMHPGRLLGPAETWKAAIAPTKEIKIPRPESTDSQLLLV